MICFHLFSAFDQFYQNNLLPSLAVPFVCCSYPPSFYFPMNFPPTVPPDSVPAAGTMTAAGASRAWHRASNSVLLSVPSCLGCHRLNGRVNMIIWIAETISHTPHTHTQDSHPEEGRSHYEVAGRTLSHFVFRCLEVFLLFPRSFPHGSSEPSGREGAPWLLVLVAGKRSSARKRGLGNNQYYHDNC